MSSIGFSPEPSSNRTYRFPVYGSPITLVARHAQFTRRRQSKRFEPQPAKAVVEALAVFERFALPLILLGLAAQFPSQKGKFHGHARLWVEPGDLPILT